MQVKKEQKIPIRMNPNRPTPRYFIIKMLSLKDKERTLEAAMKKQKATYNGTPTRVAAYFSTETLQAIREWEEILQPMKSKDL